MRKNIWSILAAIFFVVSLLSACNSGKSDAYYFPKKGKATMSQAYTKGEVEFDSSLWATPSLADDDIATILGDDAYVKVSDNRIKPILYNGVAYDNKETRVFAYIGIPEKATAKKPVPAVVLVHGGEGTAFLDWVQMWVDKGYAAIALDTEGRYPMNGCEMANGKRALMPQNIRGPQNGGYYSDSSYPIVDQWMYYAVATVISANSYLRSYPQIDKDEIGMVGVSWGGVICSITSIYDNRFAFSAPIYGALNMAGTSCRFGDIYSGNKRAAELWDNGAPLSGCDIPTYFVNGGADPAFNAQGNFKCAEAMPNSRVLIRQTLEHSQYSAANVDEVYMFADHVVKKDKPFINIAEHPTFEKPVVKLNLPDGVSVQSAELVCKDSENEKFWVNYPLNGGNEFNVEIPTSAKLFFVNITDSNGFSFSTRLQNATEQA